MNTSLKGALLSGLVFPGAGQLWLKRSLRGVAFAGAFSLSLVVIVRNVAGQALAMLERIESEGGAVDLLAIVKSAHASSYGDAVMNCASLVLLTSWLASMIDAYYLGRKQDLAERERPAGKAAP